MSASEALNILSNVPYFSEIAEEDLENIAKQALPKEYGPDQVVFQEGDRSAGLFVVESGWFKVIKISPGGREQVINFIGPGEAFNALSLFADIPNPATAIALESAKLWLIRHEVMLQMIDAYPNLAQAVIKTLAGRVLHLVALVEDLSLRSVESRLARLLLEQAADETVHRQKWATQTELAARLGTVTDVLSRALRKLSDDGLISVSRHQIQVLKPAELEARANSGQ
ncbi:MAG: Crp/Fnr family transcriptional regulator [Anaerolineae bacterium]|nr:Crp/Fnr family transcriptional regulator [Anaerolineae bacterium]